MTDNKQIDILEKECEEIGITITQLFIEAKQPQATIQNWRRNEPKSFKTLRALNSTLDRLKAEKQETV